MAKKEIRVEEEKVIHLGNIPVITHEIGKKKKRYKTRKKKRKRQKHFFFRQLLPEASSYGGGSCIDQWNRPTG